jgi:hypothetical protein
VLITMPKAAPRESAAWLTESNSTPFQRRIVRRALLDVGEVEQPEGSNRSPYIDEITRWAGLEPPQYWCAIWAARVWVDAGALVPKGFPSCDAWLPYAFPVKDIPPRERVGCAILYGVPGDARHIGIVVRVPKYGPMLSVEGNRAFLGTQSNNGEAVDLGPIMRRDVLGLVLPSHAGED